MTLYSPQLGFKPLWEVNGLDTDPVELAGLTSLTITARVSKLVGATTRSWAWRGRISDFAHKLKPVSTAHGSRGGGPLADAVHGEHHGILERRWKERAGGVTLMVFRKEQPAGPIALRPDRLQFAAEKVFLEQLLSSPQRKSHPERSQPARRERQIIIQEALELQKGLFVENHRIKLLWRHARGFQAVANRVSRKAGIVFLSGKPLLLGGRYDLAVADERRRAVVIEGGDSKYPHRRRSQKSV